MQSKTVRAMMLCLILCLTCWMVNSIQAEENEKKIGLKQLPKAVQAKLGKNAKNVSKIVMEKEDGKVVYEIEIKVDGKENELTFDAKGKLLEITEEITLKQAPEAVQKMLKALSFNGKLEGISREKEDGKISYEAEIERDGLDLEVKLDAKGNLLEIEVKADDNDDEGDDDDGDDNDDGDNDDEGDDDDDEGDDNDDGDDDEGDDNDEGDEEKITLKQAPAPVQRMLKALSFKGKLEEISREKEDGKITYEAEIERDGLDLIVELDAKGNVLEIEVEADDDGDDQGKNNDGDDDEKKGKERKVEKEEKKDKEKEGKKDKEREEKKEGKERKD